MPSELLTERRDATLVLTISEPATRNALSAQLYAAGIEALTVAESDPGVRAIVLRGDGTTFSAGGNVAGLAERRRADPGVQMQLLDRFHEFVEAVRSCPKPVIAAVEGAAAGGAFSLVLACDLIVAADDARFILSHGRLGLSPDGGGTWQLAQMLPRPLALQLVWLAEPVTAQQLNALGLVNWVAPSGGALAQALVIAERLAALAPGAIASAKELVNQAARQPLGAQLKLERDHFLENLFGADAGEGLQAFLDKRAPAFGS